MPTTKTAPKTANTKTNGNLTPTETAILQVLADAGKAVTREDIRTAGVRPSSKVLGAPTRDGLGTQGGGLEGRGYIRSERHEGERQLKYIITPAGRKALKAATK